MSNVNVLCNIGSPGKSNNIDVLFIPRNRGSQHNSNNNISVVHNVPFLCLQAYNNTGWSECSQVTTIVSPPGVPGVVTSPRVTATPTSFSICWSPPPDHGDPIIHYCVEVGDRSLTTDQTSCDVEGLSPHTMYK